ncbi:MAG: hypothetical protein R3321_05655 [Nitrososphaeraceae archaeon]|nr:hypothetical protein [Nitrososphaeraceae archaeon]
MNTCVLNPNCLHHDFMSFFVKSEKRYAVPKSLIPKYEQYDKINKFKLTNNKLVQFKIIGNCVIAHIFKLKLFNTYEKAYQYAIKKGHNQVYDLRGCRVPKEL